MGENSYGVQMTKCSLCSSVQLDRIINSYFFPHCTVAPTQYNVSGIPKHSNSWRICLGGAFYTFLSFLFNSWVPLLVMIPSVCLISTMSNPIKKCIYMQSSFYKIPSWNMCEFKQPKKELKVKCILSLIYIPSFWNTLFSWGTSKKKSACFSFKFQPFAGVVEYKEHRNLNHYRKSVAQRFTKYSSWGKLKLKLPSPVCWGLGGPLMSVLELGSIVGICCALRKNWSIKPLEK